MSKNKIIMGGVYGSKHGRNTIRVIGFDHLEVFYDAIAADQKWTFRDLKKQNYFFRLPKNNFIQNYEFQKLEEFTASELNILRPDLPMRMLRYNNLNRTDDINNTLTLLNNNVPSELEELVDCTSLYLTPLTPKKTFGKSFLVETNGIKTIKKKEILLHAMRLKLEITKNFDEIGIYRLGVKNELPLYYVGDYIDVAGFLKELK